MDQIKHFIEQHGYNFEPEILDGTEHEFETETHKGWYVGCEVAPGKWTFTFGDWRTGEKYHTKIGGKQTPEEKAKLKELKKLRDKKREQDFITTALRANELWESGFLDGTNSNYLENKKLKLPSGVKLHKNYRDRNSLIIPMYDSDLHHEIQPKANGLTIWNIQTIRDTGFKAFLPGGRTKGLYHWIGGKQKVDTIYICEGFATALTVYEAVGPGVVCAFSASNLIHVAKRLREEHWGKIVICADNDHLKEKNTGLEAAKAAASAVSGILVVPGFGERELGSDFNDIFVTYGIEKVREHFMNLETQPTIVEQQPSVEQQKKTVLQKYINGVQPMPQKYDETGKPRPHTELEIADWVKEYYGDRLLVSGGRDLFIYVGTHWKLLSEDAVAEIRNQIRAATSHKANTNKVNSIFSVFLDIVAKAPKNMFVVNYKVFSFPNGTVELIGGHGTWELKFREHRKEDYLIQVLPYPWDPTGLERNEAFEKMIADVFAGDPEKEEKIREIQEMYGAALFPYFSHVFLLHGKGNTGKTSITIALSRMLHDDNISALAPNELHGFNLESAAGKTVNILNDIPEFEPINTSILKKCEDRIPIRIDRKFKKAISAPLPNVHIYTANGIPPMRDYGSGAFERRISILKCEGLKLPECPNKNYANDVFDMNPSGVINWAAIGFLRLAQRNGNFDPPMSSKMAVKEWQLVRDPIGTFFDLLQKGLLAELVLEKDARLPKHELWTTFVGWYEAEYHQKPRVGRNVFYKRIEENFQGNSSGQLLLKKTDGFFYYYNVRARQKNEGFHDSELPRF